MCMSSAFFRRSAEYKCLFTCSTIQCQYTQLLATHLLSISTVCINPMVYPSISCLPFLLSMHDTVPFPGPRPFRRYSSGRNDRYEMWDHAFPYYHVDPCMQAPRPSAAPFRFRAGRINDHVSCHAFLHTGTAMKSRNLCMSLLQVVKMVSGQPSYPRGMARRGQ